MQFKLATPSENMRHLRRTMKRWASVARQSWLKGEGSVTATGPKIDRPRSPGFFQQALPARIAMQTRVFALRAPQFERLREASNFYHEQVHWAPIKSGESCAIPIGGPS
jgi:hypothetical protein